ncbi:mitochondrial RNA pseudouridine synthase Rpusd4 [Galendromus occidentalis]|uniref:Pseudouridylate synthase RPUSD4, mitochondrial n=1 Tax=Galendromus occidentalis TaxID=34638 RepID=A0AAJ6QUD5_9ACAR|nr:mitochondrial RNA pseudouridine synthase Rpusd4 [Galendromus occidentalis]
MAVRGLNFSFVLRKTLCQSSKRLLRTAPRGASRDGRNDDELDGSYSPYENFERTGFGYVRRDRDNRPQRHGEFEPDDRNPRMLETPPVKKKEPDVRIGAAARHESVLDQEHGAGRTDRQKTFRQPKTLGQIDFEIKTVRRKIEEGEESFEDLDSEAKSAFEVTRATRLERDEIKASDKTDSYGFRILKAEIKPQIWTMSKDEVRKCLLRNILFDTPDFLILNKPYGLSMQPGGGLKPDDKMILTTHLDEMAKALNVEKLYPLHRLDKNATGVLCLAKNKSMADVVKGMFKSRLIEKEYVAITRRVPPEKEGVIDKAIAEGSVDGRTRMVIVPTAEPGSDVSLPKFSKTYPAVTRYKVISSSEKAAFVRLWPETGYKHQIRVHLGLGLRCPVLGDHKYSHLTMIGPQKLPGEMLDRLKVRQQKVRDIPLHLHARRIKIPGVLPGDRDLVVSSSIPTYFSKNLMRLKIRY